VGAPEGGVRGWGVSQGGPAQKLSMPVQIFFRTPPEAAVTNYE